MDMSDWLKDAIILAEHRSTRIIASCSGGKPVVGYINAGARIQRIDGKIIVTNTSWTVSAQPDGDQWCFEYNNETYHVSDADFMPIVDGDDGHGV